MINSIWELFNSARSSWYSGKGHKATKQGDYEKALHYYTLALRHDKAGMCMTVPNPVLTECLSRTYARLGNYKEALLAAEGAMQSYKQLTSDTKIVSDCEKRVEQFIALLETGNADEINKTLNV